MASRSKPDRRPERGSDSMEAIKPLIVLGLFGTILYGAYSMVQKGPSREPGVQESASEAPAFAPPAVEVPPQPVAPAAVTAAPAVPPGAGLPPTGSPPSMPLTASPPAATAGPAERQPPPQPAAVAAAASPPAPASDAPPTYLPAESAPPPAQADVPPTAASGAGDERPDRLATATPIPVPVSLPPEMPPPPGSLPSSAAFATAWADAHEKLTAGRYAEALTALSVWYDDPSLGLEESHRLEDLLGQLAGTVIYSQQDLLLPPHVVAAGETLPAIAGPLGVSWQLLAKINGVGDPMQLVPGEHLKLVRGPFDAVVSVARRRLSLQVGGAYAGSFPIVVGREFLPRVGSSLPVAEVRRTAVGGTAIVLGNGLAIQPVDDPTVVPEDAAPASLIVSGRDFGELVDILGPGSSVLVRQ